MSDSKRSKSTRKSNKSRRKPNRRLSKQKSNTKQTWEKFLKNKDSVDALKKSWKSKNPQKYYKTTITKLAKKYSNKK